MKFYLISEVSERMWGLLAPHFQEAEPYHSFITAKDLRALVTQGHARLVLAIDEEGRIHGVCALEVLTYPRGRVLNIFMAGSASKHETQGYVPAMFQFIRELAQNMRCIGLSFTGRKGWLKWLKGMGLSAHECVYAWEQYGTGNDAHDGHARHDAHTAGNAAAH